MSAHSMGIIREFRTANFRVVVDAIDDDDADLSWDEDGSTRAGLNSGALVLFCARARVFYRGTEIAADYLGGCVYKSLADFQDHRKCASYTRELRANGGAAVCGSYFADMIAEVISEARRELSARPYVRTTTTGGG